MHSNALAIDLTQLPPSSEIAIASQRKLDAFIGALPQVDITTGHLLHGGLYARTIKLEEGTVLTGALIKIATTLIIMGDVLLSVNNRTVELSGYHVIPASAGRKQAFVALSTVYMTMLFPTTARTVEGAEEQFTDEFTQLFSRRPDALNETTITGE